jgi:hypothetical protein
MRVSIYSIPSSSISKRRMSSSFFRMFLGFLLLGMWARGDGGLDKKEWSPSFESNHS